MSGIMSSICKYICYNRQIRAKSENFYKIKNPGTPGNFGSSGGIVYSHTLCVRAPFQIATVSPRFTCKTCFFVGPWGPYRPLLTKIKIGINPV